MSSGLQPLRGLRRSQARLWHSLLHWGLRTGLRFAGPVFRGCGALRAVLAPSPLRGFDGFGLFRAQRAAFVRPAYGGPVFRRCRTALAFGGAVFRRCGRLLGVSSRLQPLRGLQRPATGTGMHFYVSHRPSIQHGRSTALASSLVALPASLGLLRPVSATGGGLRAPLRFACAVFRACALRVLGTSALRAFTFSQAFALQKMPEMTYTPQFAMVVLLRLTACSTPLLIGLTTACFAHCARPSCAPSFLMKASLFRYFVRLCGTCPSLGMGMCLYASAPDEGHIRAWEQAAAVAGGMGHLGPTSAPAAFYAALPAFATASGALFFERQASCAIAQFPKLFDAIHAPFGA